VNNSTTALHEENTHSESQPRNLFDYLAEATQTFAEKPFCLEDSILFTQLSYLHLDGYVKGFKPFLSFGTPISKLAESSVMEQISRSMRIPEDTCRMLRLASKSRRFGKIRVKYFAEHTDTETEKQFAAVTFLLDNSTAFVAFRGTDNTIVGWRENFNMAYMTPVPSQAESAEYLRNVINRLRTRKVYVGGHSKGGNLALYASAFCGIREQTRILGIYNLDGPGFKDDILSREEMRRIKDRIYSVLPQSSMIGTLLKSVGWQMIVHSEGEGFDQHNPVNWHFDGMRLSEAEALSKDAIVFDRVLDKWLEKLDNAQRQLIVDTMFRIIAKSGADSFNDVLSMIQNGDINALRVIKDMEPETRRRLIPLFKDLGVAYIREKIRR